MGARVTACTLSDMEWLRVERALSMASEVLDAAKWPYRIGRTMRALEDERVQLRELRHKIANQRKP